MNRESPSQRLLQDIATLIGAILPLAQLFFINLPDAFVRIFHARPQFTGISIVTLVLSYVLIAAYQSKPWFSITLPFQGKRAGEYQEYVQKINEASTANIASDDQPAGEKPRATIKPVRPPAQINQGNIIAICVAVVFLSTLAFVGTGLMTNPEQAVIILQAIAYILLVSFTALMLNVYYKASQDTKRNAEDQRERTSRAIELATKANSFGLIPQVKFISAYDDQGVPMNYHIFVEYNDEMYEITTDYTAQKLISAYKLQRPKT